MPKGNLQSRSLLLIFGSLTLIVALSCFPTTTAATAGSAPGVLDCKSLNRSGPRVTLKGEIPGDYEVFDLKIKRGNEEYAIKSLSTIDREMDPEERKKLEEDGVIANDRVITVVEDFRRGVFSIALRGVERYDLRLYAVPGTIRSRISPNSKKATFDALVIEGDGYPDWNKATRMRCSFDHSI